jgi:polysaccharide deacetylase family protein (PEP-CTERM system associated)
MTTQSQQIRNAFTVDVEDYFQVSAFAPYIDHESWDSITPRVERNTHRILELLADKQVQGTFFTLGWIAERFPGLVRDIVAHGHELASHGWSHTKVTNQTAAEFGADVSRTKSLLEDLSGTPVHGYRAASYSINTSNLWALDVLAETGHLYSSSIYPIRHDHYGMPGAPRFPYRYNGTGILEVPITTVAFRGRNWPMGGGGYFRMFPYGLTKWGMQRVNQREGRPCVFYTHPWEIDPEQPRPSGLGAKTRFRHYLNLHKTEGRLKQLLNDFSWDRMDRVFLD